MTSLWLRRAAYGLMGLALLLGAAVAWLVASFDANRYKGVAIDWMQREHRRTLAIDGPVELSLMPRIEVRASKLRLSEVGRDETFAVVDDVALVARVLPLLAGQLVVDRAVARGVDVRYARGAKGERNIEDLVGNNPIGTGAGAGPSLKFDLGGADLRDVRIRLQDELTPLAGEVKIESLNLGRVAAGVESPVTLHARLAFERPSVEGELVGRARFAWSPDSGRLALTTMQLAYKGTLPGAEAVDASLRGALEWSAGALLAQQLEVDFGARIAGLQLAASRLAVERLRYDPPRKALSIAELQLKLAGQRGADPLTATLDWPALDVDGSTLKGSAPAGTLTLGGANAYDVRWQSSAPTGSFDQLRLPGMSVTFSGRQGDRRMDGTLKGQLVLRPPKTALAFEQLDLQARVEPPGQPPATLTLRGSAHASAQAAGWNLAGSIARSAFASEGSATLGGVRPKLTAQARFDALDLDALWGRTPPRDPAPAASGNDTPIDLDVLRAVDGRFTLRAGRLERHPYRATDVRVDATLADGTLRVERLQAQAWGGGIDASGSAQAGAVPHVALKLRSSGIDVQALLNDVADSDRLEGRGRITAELASAGKSLQALRSALQGHAAVQLRDGAIRGVNLAQRLREAKAALTLRRDAVQRASQTEKTDFSELSASLRIADGVAHNDDLNAKSPFLRLAGAGQIDLGRNRIDYLLRATVADTSKGQGGAELAALEGITIPVRLSGPFDAVDWNIQWSAVASAALQRRLEERLRERLGAGAPADAASAPVRPRDALKDAIKGLMK